MSDFYTPPAGSSFEDIETIPVDRGEAGLSTKDISKLEALLRGGAQGATLGFADEITGALESGASSLGLVQDKTYEQARDEARAANKAAQKAHSGFYTGGELAGGLSTALVPGLNIAKGASLAGAVGKGVLTGAALGGASGLGSSEAADVTGAAKDTLKGAAIGGVVGGGFGAAGKALDAYKGSALRKLVQSGKNIDDPIAAQRIAGEISEDLGGKLASTPGKLAKRRDAIVDQASFDEMRFPSPKLDSERVASIAEGFADSPYTLSKLKKISEISQKADISPEEYRSLNTLLNDVQYTREGQRINNSEIKDLVVGIKKQISENLPGEWKDANKVYSGFLGDVIEPSVLDGGKFSRTGAERTEVKAQDMLSELLNEVGKGNKDALYKLEQLKSGLQGFDKKSPGLIKEASGLDAASLGKEITEGSRAITALGEYQTPFKSPGLAEGLSLMTRHPGLAAGKFALRNKLETKALGLAAKTEKASAEYMKQGMDFARTATPEALSSFAEALTNNPATRALGGFLQKAVMSGDLAKKNAAMFSALQNPQARGMLPSMAATKPEDQQ